LNLTNRASGILLHPTSLPGRFGIGDLGPEAYRFVDFLEAAGQSAWQVLPLGPTGYGDSPYQCFSAFAGNPLLVSPERLVDDGLLAENDLADIAGATGDRVDFGSVIHSKGRLLNEAFNRFKLAEPNLRLEFDEFSARHAAWLEDYALFRAIKAAHGGAAWLEWDSPLSLREPAIIATARAELSGKIEAEKFYQWLFFRQWLALKSYANERGIRIVGDAPIFVSLDSVEVWTRPDQFKLDENRRPTVVAGVPPDYFSATGQLWGNPIYEWSRMRKTGFAWWVERLRATLELVDVVRVDHFRGFCACWEVPAGDETAERGHWVPVPGREILMTLKTVLGQLPIIAEDLGVITPDVIKLRDDFGLPGMRILQFGFGGDAGNHDLPHNYIANCVAYTGTHDNDTTAGWFRSMTGKGSTRSARQIRRERAFCLKYLHSNGREIHWDFIRAVQASVANTAILPLQDVLGLDSSARMNLPASDRGNWNWRAPAGALTEDLSVRLRGLAEVYGRLPQRAAEPETLTSETELPVESASDLRHVDEDPLDE
jgi:4-alpha-glucanotransferase